jgi:hypothetical protein
MSTADSDAVAMKSRGDHATLGYHDHYIIDGGKARIVLNALVTPADVTENAPLLPLPRRAIFRRQVKPKRAIGDMMYGTAENIRELKESGIHAYVPCRQPSSQEVCASSRRREPISGKETAFRRSVPSSKGG